VSGTYTNLLNHIVFSTKERAPLIDASLRDELHKYVGGIIRGQRSEPIEIGGMPDHLHVVAKFHPEMSVSAMVRLIKSNSSKWVNERPKKGRFSWQTGYGAFSVSESQLPVVQSYVKNQESHHRKRTFQEEFQTLLDKHGINYEERYLWV